MTSKVIPFPRVHRRELEPRQLVWLGDLTHGWPNERLARHARRAGTDWAKLWRGCRRADDLLELCARTPVPMRDVIGVTAAILGHELDRVRPRLRANRAVLTACERAVAKLSAWARGRATAYACYSAVSRAERAVAGCRSTFLRAFVEHGLVAAGEMLGGGEGNAWGQVWRSARLAGDAPHRPELARIVRERVSAESFAAGLERYVGRDGLVLRAMTHDGVMMAFGRPRALWAARYGDDVTAAWRECPWSEWQLRLLLSIAWRPDADGHGDYGLVPEMGVVAAHVAVMLARAVAELVPDIVPGARVASVGRAARDMLQLASAALAGDGAAGARAAELLEHVEGVYGALVEAKYGSSIDGWVAYDSSVACAALEAAVMATRAVLGHTPSALHAAHSAEEAIDELGVPWTAEKLGWNVAQQIRDALPEAAIVDCIRAAASKRR